RSSKGGFVPERAKTTRRGRASQARSAPLDGGNERKVIRLGVLFSPPSRMLGKIVLGRRLARHLVAAVLAVSPRPGCAASLENSGLPSSDVPYTGQEPQLFDDTFRAELFGVEHTAFPPETDRALAKRTTLAGAVFPAKVVTLTRQGAPGAESYTLVIRPEGAALSGQSVSEPLSLTIPPENPTFAFLRGIGERWVGT